MEYIEISAKTVDEALTEAAIKLGIPSSEIEYEVVEKGSTGFLGIGSKNAVIKARKKFSIEEVINYLETLEISKEWVAQNLSIVANRLGLVYMK